MTGRKRLAPRGIGDLGLPPDCVLRPVVAVDIDGTLGDWYTAFFDFAWLYLGRPECRFYAGPGGYQSGKMADYLRLTQDDYRAMKLAFRQSGLKRGMEVFPGASQFAYEVRAAGAELWICTKRPYLRLDNIDPDTRFWLDSNLVKYDGVLYGPSKYQKLAELIGSDRVVAVVDDQADQLEAAKEAGLVGALRVRRSHNRKELYFGNEVDSLEEAAEWCISFIRDWKAAHDIG